MLFPPVLQPLNLKMEMDSSHPGLHTGNIQRNYFKTPNPTVLKTIQWNLYGQGSALKKDYPLKSYPSRGLERWLSRYVLLAQFHYHQTLVAVAPAWVGDCIGPRGGPAWASTLAGLCPVLACAKGSSPGISLAYWALQEGKGDNNVHWSCCVLGKACILLLAVYIVGLF